MACKTDSPHYFFRSYDPPYMSGDINPGITGIPVAGDNPSAHIKIYNHGPATGATRATVAMWTLQAGTGSSSPVLTGQTDIAVTACTPGAGGGPVVPGSGPADFSYIVPAFGGSSHFCLIAKVQSNFLGDQGRYFTPAWDAADTGDPTMPEYMRIAQRNVFIIPSGGDAGTARPDLRFAFAIANIESRERNTRLIARTIHPDTSPIVETIHADFELKPLLKRGKLVEPAFGQIAIGKERVIAREKAFGRTIERVASRLNLPREQVQKALPYPGELSQTGPLSVEEYKESMARPARPEQKLVLVPNEVRQGIVEIVGPEKAPPGSLLGVDIRHELVTRPGDKPRLLGGLIVFLRVAHPDDPKEQFTSR
jgi:hypothetical protein